MRTERIDETVTDEIDTAILDALDTAYGLSDCPPAPPETASAGWWNAA